MPRVSHVTSSGFVFERQEQVVVVRAPRRLVPLAELEFLREVEAPGGRIADVRRTTGDGRELHLVTVEVKGAPPRVVSFDAGPGFLGHLRRATECLQLVVYALAGVTAVGTLGYMLLRWVSGD